MGVTRGKVLACTTETSHGKDDGRDDGNLIRRYRSHDRWSLLRILFWKKKRNCLQQRITCLILTCEYELLTLHTFWWAKLWYTIELVRHTIAILVKLADMIEKLRWSNALYRKLRYGMMRSEILTFHHAAAGVSGRKIHKSLFYFW